MPSRSPFIRRLVGLAVFGCSVASLAEAKADDDQNRAQWLIDSSPVTATAPGGGKSVFTWNETAYARVFFDRPIKDVFHLTPDNYAIAFNERVVGGGSQLYNQTQIWI